MKNSIIRCAIAAMLTLVASAPLYAQGVKKQTVDVVGQGPAGPVVSAGGAMLIRTKNGMTMTLDMPTPVSGSYAYPPANPFQPIAAVPGVPEVFTGWAFIFNKPESCTVPNHCVPGPADYASGHGAAYNFAGHATSGKGALNFAGHISVGEAPFFAPPPGVVFVPLENPAGAEVHLAVAPHGVLLPDLLPQQLNTPIGNPTFWWIAVFSPPSP